MKQRRTVVVAVQSNCKTRPTKKKLKLRLYEYVSSFQLWYLRFLYVTALGKNKNPIFSTTSF